MQLVEPTKMKVTCPPGSYPGTKVMLNTPLGQTITAVVPAGIYPGQDFMVEYGGGSSSLDASSLKSGLFVKPAQEIDWKQPSAPEQPGSQTIELEATIPAGVNAGAQFMIATPSGAQFPVTAPPGSFPGQTIRVRVPAAAPEPAKVATVRPLAQTMPPPPGIEAVSKVNEKSSFL